MNILVFKYESPLQLQGITSFYFRPWSIDIFFCWCYYSLWKRWSMFRQENLDLSLIVVIKQGSNSTHSILQRIAVLLGRHSGYNLWIHHIDCCLNSINKKDVKEWVYWNKGINRNPCWWRRQLGNFDGLRKVYFPP